MKWNGIPEHLADCSPNGKENLARAVRECFSSWLQSSFAARAVLGLILASALVVAPGCEQRSSQTPPPGASESEPAAKPSASKFSDQLDGITLLRNLTTKYGLAQSYRDRGVLRLSYTLQDKAIVEPHPFSVCWERGHRLSARLFQAHLQSDGKLLSCYVYDINTANLDEQQLFLTVDRELPLGSLFEDSIVRHYLGGYADLPLDETDKTQAPCLIPPPLSLLTGQLAFGWVTQPKAAQRLPDQSLNGQTCYVVRSQFNDMTADIWIDQKTKLLSQISMPLKIMDRQVLTAGEIKEVELLMQFHEAQLDQPSASADAERFAVELKPKATPVRRFVSVPDPFPSERIGQLVPKFELQRPSGERVDHLHFDGKTTILFWIDNAELAAIEDKLSIWKSKPDAETAELGLVFSDADLDPSGTNSLAPNSDIAALAKRSGLSLYFDRQLRTSSLFQLRVLPAVAVIGPDSRLEFVGGLARTGWDQELANVVEKVQRGVDVAGEMKQAYQEFQESYSKQRLAASARTLLNLPEPPPTTPAQTNNAATALATTLKPTLVWSIKSLTQPGNVLVNPFRSAPSLFILDGWRSVVELDLEGQELGRFQLDLPDQGAVSCLRLAPVVAGAAQTDVHFAAFNVQADRIYLFDRNWKLAATLPPADFEHDGIRDAIFVPRDNAKPLVMVALANDGGCVQFDNESRVMKQVFRSRADSIARRGSLIYFANPTGWGLLQDDGKQPEFVEDLMYQKLVSLDSGKLAGSKSDFVGITTVDRDNNWFFGRIANDGKLAWRQPVGLQLFENEIEPLSCCVFQFDQHDGQGAAAGVSSIAVAAIADAGNRITMVSGDGSFLGQFSAPAPLTGIAILQHQGSLHLILSTRQGIANYRLSAGGTSALPVSNQKHP